MRGAGRGFAKQRLPIFFFTQREFLMSRFSTGRFSPARFSSGALCTAALCIGIVLGAQWDKWHVSPVARANAPEGIAAEGDYHELQARHSALADSSELLSKIVRLTTNSV